MLMVTLRQRKLVAVRSTLASAYAENKPVPSPSYIFATYHSGARRSPQRIHFLVAKDAMKSHLLSQPDTPMHISPCVHVHCRHHKWPSNGNDDGPKWNGVLTFFSGAASAGHVTFLNWKDFTRGPTAASLRNGLRCDSRIMRPLRNILLSAIPKILPQPHFTLVFKAYALVLSSKPLSQA